MLSGVGHWSSFLVWALAMPFGVQNGQDIWSGHWPRFLMSELVKLSETLAKLSGVGTSHIFWCGRWSSFLVWALAKLSVMVTG